MKDKTDNERSGVRQDIVHHSNPTRNKDNAQRTCFWDVRDKGIDVYKSECKLNLLKKYKTLCISKINAYLCKWINSFLF